MPPPDVSIPSPFAAPEVERYSRQMLLPQVGIRGQTLLRSSRILIVGVGGLGCPAALYLAGAGVGTLGLVDRPGDLVEASNLHRQIAHSTARVGSGKAASAAAAVRALNPCVRVLLPPAFDAASAAALAADYDVVLDCTDNVAARYLVSDACAVARTPLVSGSAIGLDGQLAVYCLNDGDPCYRCVFPTPPPPSCVGSCAAEGVLGPVPGTIGTLQALEALKIVGRMPGTKPLAARLLVFDGAEMEFRTVKLRGRDRGCRACGEGEAFSVSDFDYEAFAKGEGEGQAKEMLPKEWRIEVEVLEKMRKDAGESPFVLIDVRPKAQFEMCSLRDACSFPIDELRQDASLVQKVRGLGEEGSAGERPVVVLCRSGNKSQEGVRILRENGLGNAVDVKGGLKAWHDRIDSSFPSY